MKTLQLAIIAILIFSTLLYLKTIQADNANGVEIQNIQVEPSTIKVGDTFTVTATLVNNSTVPIVLDSGKCSIEDTQVPFFTVVFDNHAKIKSENINCAGVGWSQILNPGKDIIGTSPDYTLDYIATESGTANVTVKFSYHVINKTDPTQPNIEQTISKSLLFTISDNNTGTKKVSETVLSPLKQFKSGIAAQDVQCNTDFVLIIKSNDNSPACVRPDTSHILIQRGWAKEFVQTTGNESVEMTVIRITNNTGAMDVNYTGFRTVSLEILAKYPLLQSALQGADKQAEKFNKLCENSKCMNTLALPFGPAYSTKIPVATAKALIDDPDLHFSVYPDVSPSIYMSYINIGSVKYIISLFSPQ